MSTKFGKRRMTGLKILFKKDDSYVIETVNEEIKLCITMLRNDS